MFLQWYPLSEVNVGVEATVCGSEAFEMYHERIMPWCGVCCTRGNYGKIVQYGNTTKAYIPRAKGPQTSNIAWDGVS